MANFQNNAITDSGRILKSHVDMGAVFTPTRIVIGTGHMPAGKTARTMTDVVETVKVLPINKKERAADGRVIFGGKYSNEDITADFFFRELALYAKAVYEDGTEVDERLYSYGNAGETAELMPAYSSSSVVERQIDIVMYIGNDAQVNLTIESGLSVTEEAAQAMADAAERNAKSYTDKKIEEIPTPDVSKQIEDHNADTEAHEDLRIAVNGKASTASYTVSVPVAWVEDTTNGGYTQTVSVSGILESDNPIADVVLGSDVEANALYLAAWALVTRITTAAGSITLYANGEAPTTAFSVQLKAVR